MTRRLLVPAILLSAALAGAACEINVGDKGVSVDVSRGKAVDTWTRTYDLPATGRLEIVNVNGAIEITPGSAVQVRAEREARASSDDAARDLLGRLQIVEDVSESGVRIETKNENGLFRRGGLTVRYFVTVPAGLTVKVKTENGAVTGNGIAGDITAETTNGGIRVNDLTGALSASTVNGGVTASVNQARGPITMHAVNGGVRLTLPKDARGELEASAVNGGVSVNDQALGRREVRATLNGGGPKISLDTVNGGIRITGPEVAQR